MRAVTSVQCDLTEEARYGAVQSNRAGVYDTKRHLVALANHVHGQYWDVVLQAGKNHSMQHLQACSDITAGYISFAAR